MLLQKLQQYAETRLALPPPMYQEQSIRWLIALTAEGEFLGLIDTADSSSPATKNGERHAAPHVKRTVAVRPKLLADTGVYVLGLATPEAKPERVKQQHESFKDLVDQCAQATGQPSVHAVSRFLHRINRETFEVPSDFNTTATMTFRVDGELPIDLPSVQAFWASVQGPVEGTASAQTMSCLVCGQSRPVLERHPLKIKGIPGGQIVKDLISANAGAFESYGLVASMTAPTCQSCAEAYGNALNDLLSSEQSRIWISGIAYAFWTERPTQLNWGPMLTQPAAHQAEVKQLLESYRSGKAAAVNIDDSAFYAVALGASGARVVVRDWIDTTVGEAKRRLGRFFALQEMVDAFGAPGEPLSVVRLGNSTVRDPRKEEPPPLVSRSLLRLAISGDPLPLDLLFLSVRRNRAMQDVSRERAMLIKMVLQSKPEVLEGEESTMADLNSENVNPAYLCGRLLAVLDRIQSLAIGNPNASIVDKFYGSASSAPASVFGTLLHGTQAHMGKLQRDKAGAHRLLEAQLEEIALPIKTFPKTLTLEEQGLFALGFYHQRAADRRAVKERAEARAKTVDAASE